MIDAPARRRFVTLVVTLVVTLGASIVATVVIGSADIAPGDALASLWARISGGIDPLSSLDSAIVAELRLPRVLTAAAVGAGLAVAGAVMQALTRNQLADPYLLGLSSGASLGAVSVILLGAPLVMTAAAFLGALGALAATLAIAGAAGGFSPSRTVLAGVAVSALLAAVTSFVIFWTATGDSYRQVIGWLLGSLAGARWPQVGIAWTAVVLVAVPLILASRKLDAFAIGETGAHSLGVDVARWRWVALGGTALLTGALVSVSGSIGFVGLVIPNAVRLVAGPLHRGLLVLSALVGAVFLVWADTIARVVLTPRELPVGIVTAIIGAPLFALLLLRRNRS